MLPPKKSPLPLEQQLVRAFRRLSDNERESLVSYAEFLVERGAARGSAPEVPSTPLDIPRPDRESVVEAIRRLAATYPMLDRDELFHEASSLMTAHVMQGRAAVDVIDQLEVIFRRRYERVESPQK
jgi:hypothetical protein